jgi:hypothetical protein
MTACTIRDAIDAANALGLAGEPRRLLLRWHRRPYPYQDQDTNVMPDPVDALFRHGLLLANGRLNRDRVIATARAYRAGLAGGAA